MANSTGLSEFRVRTNSFPAVTQSASGVLLISGGGTSKAFQRFEFAL